MLSVAALRSLMTRFRWDYMFEHSDVTEVSGALVVYTRPSLTLFCQPDDLDLLWQALGGEVPWEWAYAYLEVDALPVVIELYDADRLGLQLRPWNESPERQRAEQAAARIRRLADA